MKPTIFITFLVTMTIFIRKSTCVEEGNIPISPEDLMEQCAKANDILGSLTGTFSGALGGLPVPLPLNPLETLKSTLGKICKTGSGGSIPITPEELMEQCGKANDILGSLTGTLSGALGGLPVPLPLNPLDTLKSTLGKICNTGSGGSIPIAPKDLEEQCGKVNDIVGSQTRTPSGALDGLPVPLPLNPLETVKSTLGKICKSGSVFKEGCKILEDNKELDGLGSLSGPLSVFLESCKKLAM